MVEHLEPLRAAVQRNCDLSDALFARNYTMCTYLLKMREYFRWDQGYTLTDSLSGEAIGEWVAHRERLWDSLSWQDYACLPVDPHCYDPFDSEAINRALVPRGLVYSGGYGGFGKPHFFLGELLSLERRADLTIYVSSSEYARELTAPPAMIQGQHIFVRRESLRRSIWELIEEWRWTRRQGPMAYVLEAYAFDRDPEAALERITDDQVSTAVLHEMGEAAAGAQLGPTWEKMLTSLGGFPAELMARAVRDHLADCLVTLPKLLENAAEPPLHFYFAGLRGVRRQLFPEAMKAYAQWAREGDLATLRDVVHQGERHFARLANAILEACCEDAEQTARAISALLANDEPRTRSGPAMAAPKTGSTPGSHNENE